MGKEVQRALLWVILCGSLFMLWDNYQVYKGGKSLLGLEPIPVEQTEQAATADIPAPTAASAAAQAVPENPVKAPVVVTTDRMKVTFDQQGARIVGTEMLLFPQQRDWKEVGLAGMILGREPSGDLGNVKLLESTSTHTYAAQSGLVGGNYPTHADSFKLVSQSLSMDGSDKLDVVFEAEKGGVTVRKTYTFKRGYYGIDVATTVKNGTSAAIKPQIYYQITRDSSAPAGASTMYSTFTGPAFYSDEEKFQKITFDEIADKDASFVENTDNGWLAMVQHHFVSAWVPPQGEARQNYAREVSKDLYAVGTLVSMNEIAPGAEQTDNAIFYSGPQEQERLEQLAPGLELVVDYGWLTFLAKPIYWLLSFLYGIVGNWGWSIVLLTCIVKAVLYPVSAAGYRSMARMKEVQPRMKALQDKYKDDKQRLNQAMMELYRTEKINPVGGCLPIALQIPVFLALYWVLQGSVELRGAPWLLWVQDLAVPDPWFVLPALMAATMFLQIFLNPKPTDPTQAKVMYIMPIVFSVMFFVFAAGLVLYWLTNNVLSILQQWWINKTIADERAQRLAKQK
ncbi:membrane protein insertase YidC [Sutterella sp.]|uniref:membrane protein insertase YidC n=1 Tax=Sutterella sp. TaxID=1981025 RepID=UPI0026DFD8FB|nr:membrane protein insertase YidC [Sutterella sp.]MDO5530435.1 membrane protein insertase YidC [Sutterella sp.]